MESVRHIARHSLPSSLAQTGRRWGVKVRSWREIKKAQVGFQEYGDTYQHPLLFVAGLPKSGTSWLESMLSSYPGYQHVTLPEAVEYELHTGGSHDFELPADLVDRFREALVVSKLHVHGSPHNARLLHAADVPYVVLYRDLRDVAVSHYFYVRRTPWHPEYDDYATLCVEDGLLHFGRTLLPDFVDWVRTWRNNRDPSRSIELRYEDLLRDTMSEFRSIVSHFGLDGNPERTARIVAEHSFENMTSGRRRGQQNSNSFVRKGISGDWQNHFNDELKALFKEEAGTLLVELGYEKNHSW